MKELIRGHTAGSCPPQTRPPSGHLLLWRQLQPHSVPGRPPPRTLAALDQLSGPCRAEVGGLPEADDSSDCLGISPPSPLGSSRSRRQAVQQGVWVSGGALRPWSGERLPRSLPHAPWVSLLTQEGPPEAPQDCRAHPGDPVIWPTQPAGVSPQARRRLAAECSGTVSAPSLGLGTQHPEKNSSPGSNLVSLPGSTSALCQGDQPIFIELSFCSTADWLPNWHCRQTGLRPSSVQPAGYLLTAMWW